MSTGTDDPAPGPQTIGEVIRDNAARHKAQADAQAAAATADKALLDANEAVAESDHGLGADLQAIGEVAVSDPDSGKLSVYRPDGDGGFHVSYPKPDSTPLPTNPTPPAPPE